MEENHGELSKKIKSKTCNENLTQYEKAVVIGLYRQGATWEEISALMNITIKEAKKVVGDYLKKNDYMSEYKYKALKINGKRIDEHRYVMQCHLGRKLLPTEIVRHHDGNTRNNVIENLYVINRNEQIDDQIKKGEVSQQIKDGLERKKLGIKIKKKKWHPEGWIPKATGRPRKEVNPNITSAVISRNSSIKKKAEKVYETKKVDTSKLVSLKIDRRTTIYIKEGLPQTEIDKILKKYESNKFA